VPGGEGWGVDRGGEGTRKKVKGKRKKGGPPALKLLRSMKEKGKRKKEKGKMQIAKSNSKIQNGEVDCIGGNEG